MKKIKNKFFLCLLLFGVFMLTKGIKKNHSLAKLDYKEKEAIEEFFMPQEKEESLPPTYEKIEYIAILKIPKIGLERGLLDKNHPDNTVDKNIEILKVSTYPSEKNSFLALAGHSGNSVISYFNELDKISIHDLVYVDYNSVEYVYRVSKIERQEKRGFIYFSHKKDTKELLLTTCDPKDKNKQLIISAFLEKENPL